MLHVGDFCVYHYVRRSGLTLLFLLTTLSAFAETIDPNVPLLWREQADLGTMDLTYGAGGQELVPAGPFTFIEEDKKGTTPKVLVTDANGRKWQIKFGEEVKSEVFATRIMWALGYIVEPEYYVRSGKVLHAKGLRRAAPFINNGNFSDARLQLRDPKWVPVEGQNWTFKNVGEYPSFKGLKIMMMLLSNWDVKDARSRDNDANTSIMRRELPNGGVQMEYIINDWGATMGKWGGISTRSKWDCKGYTNESNDFVKGVKDGKVEFGYQGKLTSDIASNITVGDVQWLMLQLKKLSDDEIHQALAASGANAEETACFTTAMRTRINALAKVAGQ